ncbi:TonB-dependent receptor [Zobellia barbeyronii]|uniref:TonB-dependent receptor n=1 Tax=Zobellia barbeyronii TaxID=2748009 RepID=A0ABS5WHS2_9FLAO|nr:TonB-dependent receptor [Zobellia barbeyronii]MBT2162725.1 TonB-dependent receptor [Zobellia barbeyronii]
MKYFVMFLVCLVITSQISAQEKEIDSVTGKKINLDEVFVSAIRVNKTTPVTFSNLNKEEFASRNLGQDIPILMNFLPGVVTTSDAGAGVGYTGIRVRGSDNTRVNVTINGIPYNDSESHGTFWVNMPDFASSTESLQLQRGVGTSTNGSGAFGASLNLLTDAVADEAFAQISSSVGSFKTLRNNIKFSTGLLNDHIEISGRLSRITSDGYVDRASSDLDSYFLQAAYTDDKTQLKALLFGGHEVTYQSWFGFDPSPINLIGQDGNIDSNRSFNIGGVKLDDNGDLEGFYDRQVDNYKQNHAQFLWNEKLSNLWSFNLALHYTKGRGYFEEYVDDWYYTNVLNKGDSQLNFIGLDSFTLNGEEITSTDYIRRRWLENNFYGTVFSADYTKDRLNVILGGGWNSYQGDHFGEVIWADYAADSQIRDRYYEDDSNKTDFNFYTKANYGLNDKWNLFADLQYRRVGYLANGEETGLVDDTFHFFNPKAGVVFDLNANNNFYFSYAVANREPNRSDYENGDPKPEKLNDFELGWRYVSNAFQLNANAYYMRYKDQLVLTGGLNDSGAPLRENVGDSYRAGIELDANIFLGEKWQIQPNVAISSNKNLEFFFERDGVLQDLGNTNIAYSPNVVIGNRLAFSPVKNFQISALSKYVGEQYMGNIDSENSVLDAYSQTDLNIQYVLNFKSVIKSITLSGLVNNIFDEDIVSNGYFYTYDDDSSGSVQTIEGAGYYPQAGTNFLLGATVRF